MQEPVVLNSPQKQPPKLIFETISTGYQFNSLPTDNSCSSDDGPFKDDIQNLLPQSTRLSENSLSRTSVVSNSDGGISADGETPSGSNSLCSADSPPCDLSLIERLLFTHPVWFLPGIQRSGAIHFLQSKEEGNFIVRGSSQPNTMAVSVRLPPNAGPYIEHYLIQSINGALCLESSRFKFDSIPALIAHYSQCCDELPVQLVLPNALRCVKNRQQLSSLALLGQEFWRYPMSSAKPNKQQEESLLDAKSPISTTDTSGLGTTLFSDSNTNCVPSTHLDSTAKVCNIDVLSSSANTPSDTTCSMSSFATNCHQIQSDPVKPNMLSSVIETSNKPQSGISLKLKDNKAGDMFKVKSFENNKILTNITEGRAKRPNPPNTLNLDLSRAPAPPITWWKPFSPNNHNNNNVFDKTDNLNGNNNFTVTTTVTFSMDKLNSPQFLNVVSPDNNRIFNSMGNSYITFETFSKRLSPEGECKDPFLSQGSCKDLNIISNNDKDTTDKTNTMKARRGAKHYRECDILQSPEIYCQNSLNDKITNYEDLWPHESDDRVKLLSSFKAPSGQQGKRPDLLPESARIICHNNLMTIESESATATSTSTNLPPIHKMQSSPIISNNESKTNQFTEANFQNCFKENRPTLQFERKNLLNGQDSNDDDDDSNNEVDDDGDARSTENLIVKSNHGSPFYADPADTVSKTNTPTVTDVLRRPQKDSVPPVNQRHSEPFTTSGFMRIPICLKLITSEIDKINVSLDEMENNEEKCQKRQEQSQQQQANTYKQKQLAKQTQRRFEQWQLDSSWEFMPKKRDTPDYNYNNNFNLKENKSDSPIPIISNKNSSSNITNNFDEKLKPLTVHDIIAKRLPDFNLPDLPSSPCQKININLKSSLIAPHKKDINDTTNSRLSSYDNVERNYNLNSAFFSGLESSQSDDGTVFSEPWDSTQWEIVLPQQGFHTRNKITSCIDGPGESVRNYTLNLANDLSTTFARNIENFICCTKESRESVPQIVMRNMRQFMNGMKNYLVKHGENKFHQEVEVARTRLKANEFLNLDAILETVMHQLVILPLREHLYGMFVDHYTRTNDLQLLAQNVRYACSRKAGDFCIRSPIKPPSTASLQIISSMLMRFQEAELPLEKLDLFLCVISTIFETSSCPRGQQLAADDFLPILVYVVAKCGFIGAEIEAEFIWGLLQPTVLNGESGYYLTALCSAVHVLKNFMNFKNESTGHYDFGPSLLPDHLSSVLRVIIPDECVGSLHTRTLPVRPHTTTREVCRIIAHKARITNPQDYGLFKLVDGEETLLNDTECPQNIRSLAKDKQCILVYKRLDAKIVWPTSTQKFLN